MAAEFICPHCESTIPDSDQRADALSICPYCNARLATAPPAPVSQPVANPSAVPATATLRFSLTCERCGSILEANSNQAGRTARCPTCGATFIVPTADPHTGLPVGRAVATSDGLPPTPMHAYAAAGARAPRIEIRDDGTSSIVCPRCDARNLIDADLCRACGTPFTIEGTGEVVGLVEGVSTSAMLSLSLGLLACLPVGPLAIVFGAVALYRAARRPGQKRTRAIASIGIGLGVVTSLAWTAYWV